jgi:hypothetical protein
MVNPDSDPDVGAAIYVPVTQRSRIPVPVDRQTYEGPSRTPAQPEFFRTSQRNIGYGHGRQEAPQRYQPYNIPAPTSTITPLNPRDYQGLVHCPNKRSSRVAFYPDSLAPSSSGMWAVSGPSNTSRSGITSIPAPRGILKTADGRRRYQYQ